MWTTQAFSVSYFPNPYITKSSIIFRYLLLNAVRSGSPTECCISGKQILYFLLVPFTDSVFRLLFWSVLRFFVETEFPPWGAVEMRGLYWCSFRVVRSLDIELPFICYNGETSWLLDFQWMNYYILNRSEVFVQLLMLREWYMATTSKIRLNYFEMKISTKLSQYSRSRAVFFI